MENKNLTIDEYDYEDFDDGFSLELKCVIGITLSFLVIVTVAGNVLTIVSFLRDKQLRTIQNIYIFNLSIVDLTVGVVSVPYYIFYTINNYTWTFGRTWCKIWLVIDFLICAESSLTIILISFDRFMLISLGASYRLKQTVKRAILYIVCSWILSFLLYGPAIIFWEYWVGASIVPDDDCDVEFFDNMEYTLITAMLEFFIPLVLTAYFNLRVYLNIRRRSRKVSPATSLSYYSQTDKQKTSQNKIESAQTRGQSDQDIHHEEGSNDQPHAQTVNEPDQLQRASQGNIAEGQDIPAQDQAESQTDLDEAQHDIDKEEEEGNGKGQRQAQNNLGQGIVMGHKSLGENSNQQREYQSNQLNASSRGVLMNAGTSTSTQGMIVQSQHKARQFLLQRDRRAARSLSFLVIVYFLCWAPYIIMTFIESVRPDTVDKDLYEAANFLLWVNSACNPFLYALMSQRFRKNFKQLLCICKSQIHP